jgi:YesN/AraC family two-component response regulator
MKLYIKNMVCIRCKMVVRDELLALDLTPLVVDLGQVEIAETISDIKRDILKIGLLKSGLELMDDKKSILIEKIKNVITEMVHYAEEEPKVNFSTFLSEKLHYDYTYMANLFSDVVGVTIEHHIIANKIERVKELLVYEELSLTEIAHRMHYSSVAHLANQFKKVTGLTTTHFKHLKHRRLISLETL